MSTKKRLPSSLFRTPGAEFWTRLVEGEFPDYRQVLQRPTQLSLITMSKRVF
jgi:DNA polymerase III sliding clamp (beta) subunit (PCNA family)